MGYKHTYIIFPLPSEATLQVMVAIDNVHQPLQNHLTLGWRQTVDRFDLNRSLL